LGLQPRRTLERINSHLAAWASKGVLGHFTKHDDSSSPPFLDIDDAAAEHMAPIVGAKKCEIAVMETLTANLHLLMASFYRPSKEKYKIIIEGKAFPSDHVRNRRSGNYRRMRYLTIRFPSMQSSHKSTITTLTQKMRWSL